MPAFDTYFENYEHEKWLRELEREEWSRDFEYEERREEKMKMNPCCKCGGEAKLTQTSELLGKYYVICNKCGEKTDISYYKNYAVDEWNKKN